MKFFMFLIPVCLFLTACHPSGLSSQPALTNSNTPSLLPTPTPIPASSQTTKIQLPPTINPDYSFGEPVLLISNSAREYHPKWSHSGETLGYVKSGQGKTEIWFHPIDGDEPYSLNLALDGDLAFVWGIDDQNLLFDAYDQSGILSIWTLILPEGSPQLISDPGCGKGNPAWSPDNSQAAYVSETDIWILPMDGGPAFRFTNTPADEWHPGWSPDSSQMIYTSDETGNADLWIQDISSGEKHQLTTNRSYDDRGIFSPDGKFVLFVSDREGSDDIWLYRMEDGAVFQVTDHPGMDSMPDWHPDGKSIVFMSDRNGNWDIWSLNIFE